MSTIVQSFKDDPIWMQTKKLAREHGFHGNAIEMATHYRELGGTDVFVYSLLPKDKRLIVTVMDDDTVLLVDTNKQLVTDEYENVLNSRKQYTYNPHNSIQSFSFRMRNGEEEDFDISIETHQTQAGEQ